MFIAAALVLCLAGPVSLIGQWELEQDTLRAQVAALAGDSFEPGAAEGRSLSLDEVVEEALRSR